jgi:hypothetical protein
MFALVVGGAIAGLLGAILACRSPPLATSSAACSPARRAAIGPDGPSPISAHPRSVVTPDAGRPTTPQPRPELDGPRPDPYKILQVDPEAEDEVIQAIAGSLKYHPDRAARRGQTNGRHQRRVGAYPRA